MGCRGLWAALAIFAGTAWGSCAEAAGPPTTNLISADPVATSSGWIGSGTTHTTGVAALPGTAPEIAALARSLGADRIAASAPGHIDQSIYIQKVFEYVRNNIEVEFRFGLSKGARGALIDQYGDPWDQAALMVALLREGGVTANYQHGTISLTAKQFGHWTGMVKNLAANSTANPYTNPQNFDVGVVAACTLLSDGGIPNNLSSPCSASGNLGSGAAVVTMSHVWVVVGGQVYDPSYKQHTLFVSQDLHTMMGCGTSCASVTDPIVANAQDITISSDPTLTGATAAVSGIDGSQRTAVATGSFALGVNLQHAIEATDRSAEVVEVVGGMKLYPIQGAAPSGPTYTAVGSSWTEIPDQYRVKLTVKTPGMTGNSYYADELAGRRLRYNASTAPQLDGQAPVQASCTAADCSASPTNEVVLVVERPYPAQSGTYGDETAHFSFFEPPTTHTDYFEAPGSGQHDHETSQLGSYPLTIMHGFGEAAVSAQQHMSAALEAAPAPIVTASCAPSTGQTVYYRDCPRGDEPSNMESLRVNDTLLSRIVGAVTTTKLTQHGQVGVMYSSRRLGASPANDFTGGYMSVQTTESIDSSTGAGLRTRALEVYAAAQPRMEALTTVNPTLSYNQWLIGGFPWNADKIVQITTASGMTSFFNSQPSVTTMIPNSFPTMAEYQDVETRRRQMFQNAANMGFMAIMGINTSQDYYGAHIQPDSEIFLQGNARAHTLWESAKGAAVPGDPLQAPIASTKVAETAAPRRHDANVSLADGSLSFTAPADLTTGAGDFPYSLSFVRSYQGGSSEREEDQLTDYVLANGGSTPQRSATSHVWKYSGPGKDTVARLGGGWTHNFDVTLSLTGDAGRSLGSEYANEAALTIAEIVIMNDVSNTNMSIRDRARMASINVGYYYDNLVLVHKGPSTESFFRMVDGTFSPSTGSASRLSENQHYSYSEWDGRAATGLAYTYTMGDGQRIFFDQAIRRQWHCVGLDQSAGLTYTVDPNYRALYWTFPNGVRIDFDYTWGQAWTSIPDAVMDNCSGSPAWVLNGVHNNLGRQLHFTTAQKVAPFPTDFTTASYLYGTIPPSIGVALPLYYKITAVSDENNRQVQLALSNQNGACATLICDIFTVTDPSSLVTRYEYTPDANNPDPTITTRSPYRMRRWRVPGQTTAEAPYQSFVYDGLFRVQSIIDASGAVTGYYPGSIAGSEVWREGAVVSPRSTSTSVIASSEIYDRNNNPIISTDPLGNTTLKTFDGYNRLLTSIMPEGNGSSYSYDVRGNQLSEERCPKAGGCGQAGNPISSTTYEEASNVWQCVNPVYCNLPASSTDYMQKTSNYAHNSTTGQMTQVQLPADSDGVRPQTDYGYTSYTIGGYPTSLLTSQTKKIDSATNTVTTYAYEPSNKYVLKTATVDPTGLNLQTTLTFDAVGNLTALNGPRPDAAAGSDISSFVWDADRRLVYAIAPDPDGTNGTRLRVATKSVYNSAGLLGELNLGTTSQGNGSDFSTQETTAYTYNVMGDRTRVDSPTVGGAPSKITRYTYDLDGNLICTAVRMNIGTLPGNICNLGTEGSFGPDRLTLLTYDKGGRKVKETHGYQVAGQAITFGQWGYSPNGDIISETDANGNETTYLYDDYDRLQQTTYPSSAVGSGAQNSADYETFGYNANDVRTSWRRRDGITLSFTVDNLGRETHRNYSSGATDVWTEYDLLNEKLFVLDGTATAPSANGVGMLYDKAGRLTRQGTYGRRLNFLYEDNVNRTRITWPDGFYASYAYDAAGGLSSISENGTTNLISQTYNDMGRRTGITRANSVSSSAGYDTASRLLSFTHDLPNTVNDITWGFSYNPAGQIYQQTASNSAWEATLSAASESHTYDGLNRDAAIAVTTGGYDARGNLTFDGVRHFTYDAENRLISATGGSSSITLAYDPTGRLNKTTAGSTVTSYLYDGQDLVGEYDSSGNVLRRYLHGVETDDPMVWYEGSGTTNKHYLLTDTRGSIAADVTTSGALTRYTYGPYGEPNNWIGSRFRYTGQIMIPEAQLYYYKARVYDPASGRFLQTDPIGYKDDLDLYVYVGDDPVDRGDPSGLCDMCSFIGNKGVDRKIELKAEITVAKYALPGTALVLGCAVGVCEAVAGGAVLRAAGTKVGIGSATGAAVNGAVAMAEHKPVLPAVAKGAVSGAATSAAGLLAPGRATKAAAVGATSAATTKATGGSNFQAALSGTVSAGVEYLTNNPKAANAAALGLEGFLGDVVKSLTKKTVSSSIKEGGNEVCKRASARAQDRC